MPIPNPPSLPVLWQAVFGGGGLMVLVVFLREVVVFLDKKRTDRADKKQAEAEKDKGDKATVEIARLHENSERERRAEDAAWRLAEERKGELAGVKAEQSAMRQEFDAKVARLEEAQVEESEHRRMAQVSANAAIDRAEEAIRKLEAAKVERDGIATKLREVEQRSEQMDREKNAEIENLRAQLKEANRNIETLQTYIREHKLSVTLRHGEEIITASMQPSDLPDLPEPPTRDTDF